MSLRRILGYRWHDYMSNDLVLRDAGLRQVTCIVGECQRRLYGHVARLPAVGPAHWILPCRDPKNWSMPRWRPHASWLRKVESYLTDAGMAGLASAWAMARRRPKSTVARWTGRRAAPAYAPIPDLTWFHFQPVQFVQNRRNFLRFFNARESLAAAFGTVCILRISYSGIPINRILQ